MTLNLLPQPKRIRYRKEAFVRPRVVTIGIPDAALYPVAAVAAEVLHPATVHISTAGVPEQLTLAIDSAQRPGGYRLAIRAGGITITGQDANAVAYGIQTLRQVVEASPSKRLPGLTINDWPDFAERGLYYDVCRGRVPKRERLKELAEHLARYKINHLQLYIEHTFAFRGHPKIGQGASPLTAEDILQLDAHCAARGIELVPSLATFGHLATVLKHREYHHLAEDGGTGNLVTTEGIPAWFGIRKAWSLAPAVPEIYPFLDSLFAEFLPLFRSNRFNICCDETFDIGCGQSYALCRQQGKGKVYLGHIQTLRRLARKYGKTVMFWGDIIRRFPELIPEIPRDVTVLDWGYAADHPFHRIRDFKNAALPCFACPGTSSWISLFPRLPEAMANIHGFAKAGRRHGAQGLLVTDWGDGGHHNFMEFSWHGYLFGAEQGWNVNADRSTFALRFANRFLKSDSKALINAIRELGRAAQVQGPFYQSIWYHAFFAVPGDRVFHLKEPVALSEAGRDGIGTRKRRFNAAYAAHTLHRMEAIRPVLARAARRRGVDPLGVLPYWVFACDTMTCAARKVTVLGPGGRDTPAARRQLKRELTALMHRFEALWMARNRRSEIRTTLKRYRRAIAAL